MSRKPMTDAEVRAQVKKRLVPRQSAMSTAEAARRTRRVLADAERYRNPRATQDDNEALERVKQQSDYEQLRDDIVKAFNP